MKDADIRAPSGGDRTIRPRRRLRLSDAERARPRVFHLSNFANPSPNYGLLLFANPTPMQPRDECGKKPPHLAAEWRCSTHMLWPPARSDR
jgi:hypothetical protein